MWGVSPRLFGDLYLRVQLLKILRLRLRVELLYTVQMRLDLLFSRKKDCDFKELKR